MPNDIEIEDLPIVDDEEVSEKEEELPPTE